MTDIFEETALALAAEESVVLATIIAATGSTPAAAHAKMLVTRGGASIAGSVGGGCMEGDVIAGAARLYGTGKASIVTFHLNEDRVEEGLICGGTLDILLEPVTRADLPLLRDVRARRDDGEDCVLVTAIGPDGTRGRKFIAQDDPHPAGPLGEAVARAARKQTTERLVEAGTTYVIEPIAGTPRLVVFGGGHVSKFLVRTAAMAGFRVTVFDDRPSFADRRRFPDAAEALAAPYETAFDSVRVTPSSYLVIVTRGHRYDELLLEGAIRTPAKYIGMIGSKRKILASFANIAARGGSAEALARVRTPIGIEIGAVSAEEIAVSIVAELIRVRRGERLPLRHKSGDLHNA